MFDIAIAVALGVLTLITAYLGVHVTLHPAGTPREKLAYKVGFSVCGAIACVLIGVQAYRGNQAQAFVKQELSQIGQNTKKPPTVEVTNVMPAPQVTVLERPNLALKKKIIALSREIDNYYSEAKRSAPNPGFFAITDIDRTKEPERWDAERVRQQAESLKKYNLWDTQIAKQYEVRFKSRVLELCKESTDAGLDAQGLDKKEAVNSLIFPNVSYCLKALSDKL